MNNQRLIKRIMNGHIDGAEDEAGQENDVEDLTRMGVDSWKTRSILECNAGYVCIL